MERNFFDFLFIPVLIITIGLIVLGNHLGKTTHKTTFWIIIGVVLAIPAFLLDLHYLHILDRYSWYYEYRANPISQWLASGIGFLTGVIVSQLGKISILQKFQVARGILVRSTYGFCLLALFIPYMKPLIAPVLGTKNTWRDGVCIQSTPSTCGPSSAATILNHYGIKVTEAQMAKECHSYGGGTEIWYIARAIRRRGFNTHFKVIDMKTDHIPCPSIAGTGFGNAGHFISIYDKIDTNYVVGDPLSGKSVVTEEKLKDRYRFTGFFLIVKKS